jgi:hypothetical protein
MSTEYKASALYSTVKNTSGTSKIFGFLPPHGRRLADNEEFTVYGDIRQAIANSQRGGRAESRRDIMAFEAAMQRGDIEVVHTPAPILQDEDTGDVAMLELEGGVLHTTAPCWGVSEQDV